MTIDHMPALSICIPTFNRSALLEEALTTLLNDISEDFAHDIEVVISDNASTDNTQQICEKFCREYSQINWVIKRQSSSIGADNVQYVATLAHGRYIWILSDDDLILPGALKTLLDNIKDDYDILITNHTSFDVDPAIQSPPHFKETSDVILKDKNEVIEYLCTMVTFLSVICFRADLVDTNAYKFAFGSNLPQSYMFIDAIIKSRDQKLISTPILTTRRNNTGGYNVFNVFIEKFFTLLEYSGQRGVDFVTIERVKRKHLLKFLLPLVVLMKTDGVGTLTPDWVSTKGLFNKFYSSNITYRMLVMPMISAPPSVVYMLSKTHKFLKGSRR